MIDTQASGMSHTSEERQRPDRRFGFKINDRGFTLAETVIVIVLTSILGFQVWGQASEMIDSARDATVKRTLLTALTTARTVYSRDLGAGKNNFAGNTTISTANAVASYSASESDIAFEPWATTALDATDQWDSRTVWVDVPGASIKASADIAAHTGEGAVSGVAITADTTILAGQLVRLGVVSDSGASYCVIVVQSATQSTVVGSGYQSVSAEDTVDHAMGADCGAAETADNIFNEMPNNGTDAGMQTPRAFAAASTGYGGNSGPKS